MACPSDSNTGFISIQGPIQQSDLNGITVEGHPLYIKFAPRTTPPSIMQTNYINDTTGNTCTYKSLSYNLIDIQFVDVIHKGYSLPGQTQIPIAELVLSFSPANTTNTYYSGILMCVPIFNSGAPSHSDYLDQLIDPSMPTCNHTRDRGSDFTIKQQNVASTTTQNSTLPHCISKACGDSSCLAYTYKSGTCYTYNEIPSVSNTGIHTTISGKIDRVSPTTCNAPRNASRNASRNATAESPTIESIFTDINGDTTQVSLSYKTCFETVSNNTLASHSLYVILFPNGIHMTSSGYQQLVVQMGGSLLRYRCSSMIKGDNPTALTFEFDNTGQKKPLTSSTIGYIPNAPLSSCTEEFRDRLEFFTNAPKRHKNTSNTNANANTCPVYKTNQYKCVPFNKLKDLSGDTVTKGKTLDKYLLKPTASNEGMSVVEIEALVGTLGSIVVVLFVAVTAKHFWDTRAK